MLKNTLTQSIHSRYRLRWFQIVLVSILALPLMAPAPAAAADTAVEVVENLHAELLVVMKQADELGYEGRYQRLAPVVTFNYNLPLL